jgi:hypothetical protein
MALLSDNGEIAFLEGPSALVSLGIEETKQYMKPSSTGKKWSPWGEDNLLPQNIIEKVEKNVVASSGLEWLVDAFYGNGVVTYKKIIKDGKEVLDPVVNKDFEDFKRNNDFDRYIEEAIYDFIYFKSLFPEMALNKFGSKKVVNLWHKEASACRWGVMDEKKKEIDKLFFSYNWDEVKDEWISEIPVFDPKRPDRHNKFIQRVKFPTIGKTYYAKAAWHSIIDSGWLDISNNIPIAKQSLLKNNMAIKYHIRIPKTYWQDKYKKWSTLSPDEQKKIRSEELTAMNDFLSGKENLMKTFISHYGIDRNTGKEIPGWEILKIDNSIADGALTIDQAEANAMILFGLNIDPTLKGAGLPNSKQSSGSGSDKRTAFNIYRAQQYRNRQRFFAPLYFIRDFNKWDPNLIFAFKDTELTTLDANPTSTQNVING